MRHRGGNLGRLRGKEGQMHIAAGTARIANGRAGAPLDRVTASPLRLWPSLTAAWMRHLDRRIDDDLSWFDPRSTSDEIRSAPRG
jgi:hypothetical protein